MAVTQLLITFDFAQAEVYLVFFDSLVMRLFCNYEHFKIFDGQLMLTRELAKMGSINIDLFEFQRPKHPGDLSWYVPAFIRL